MGIMFKIASGIEQTPLGDTVWGMNLLGFPLSQVISHEKSVV